LYGDGHVDCEDLDCAPVCVEFCDDGVDNDGDGLLDCEDADCIAECTEICDDGIDNDRDGLLDCEDDDCMAECAEICDDGWDNDHDGATDDMDPDCHVVSAQVISGQWAWDQHNGGCKWPMYVFGASARDVRGVVTWSGSGTRVTCDWSVDYMAVRTRSSGSSWESERVGFDVSTACPVQTSGFLPNLTVSYVNRSGGPSGWYQVSPVFSTTYTNAGWPVSSSGTGFLIPGTPRTMPATELGL
jgi:hypothetical protein